MTKFLVKYQKKLRNMFGKFQIKTPEEIEIMHEGGKKLGKIKKQLAQAVKIGVSAYEIDKLAEELILASGGEPSFKKVSGYYWTTCVNVNEGIVHGIPKKTIIFKKGDLVSIDVGMYYEGFHTDTSISVGLELSSENQKFLEAGKEALNKAISKVKKGNRIYNISETMEKTLLKNGYNPVTSLVGHGVGRELHEEPQVPCFTLGEAKDTPEIQVGMTLAIEVMYTLGTTDLVYEEDGWTIATADGKISGLFEETVAVTNHGPVILTA